MLRIILFSILVLVPIFANSSTFVKVGDVVVDKSLDLMWQDDIEASRTKISLEDGIAYCKNLKLNGFTNWHLPTYEELLSIGDYEVYKPTLNSAFKNSASGHFWSIIYKRVAYGDSWKPVKDYYVQRIYFSDGYSYDNDRTGKAYVRCVRSLQ